MTSLNAVTTSYALSAEEKSAFDTDGYVKLRGVLDPAMLESYGPLITDKVMELNGQSVALEDRDTYGKAFLQVTNLWQHSEQISTFVKSPDLARLAAELLGVRSVRLYDDQALYKEPSGGITPWHADQYYWPFSTDRCVTVWIPLQDTAADMGPLTFAAGSHQFNQGRDLPISDESENQIQQLMLQQGFAVDADPYKLGDLSFHQGWTFHRAGENSSTEARRVMTMIYVDADMIISEPTNEHQRADLGWMPGCYPGDPIESPINPVLYP